VEEINLAMLATPCGPSDFQCW